MFWALLAPIISFLFWMMRHLSFSRLTTGSFMMLQLQPYSCSLQLRLMNCFCSIKGHHHIGVQWRCLSFGLHLHFGLLGLTGSFALVLSFGMLGACLPSLHLSLLWRLVLRHRLLVAECLQMEQQTLVLVELVQVSMTRGFQELLHRLIRAFLPFSSGSSSVA